MTITMSYTLQFIDIPRFMVSPLSNLVNNLSEEIHDDKKCETCGIKYSIATVFLNT